MLAFDHELSLGGTSDYQRNLFEPTKALLDLADEAGVRVSLFTDVLSAIVHERWGVDEFTRPYRESIVDATKRRHDVQLHLHPHWLTSQWQDARFEPSSDFALSDFAREKGGVRISDIVRLGAEYLRKLCLTADSSYQCVAFRAGGYNLAPNTDEILRALYDNGIRIDSSIIKDYRFKSGLSTLDFSGMPSSANWFIAPGSPLRSAAPSGILEVPIASSPRTPLNSIGFLARRVMHQKRCYNNKGYGIHEQSTSRMEKLRRLFTNSSWPLSFDSYADTSKDAFAVFHSYVQAHRHERKIFCATVSHPKSMGSHARQIMRGFIDRVRDAYEGTCDFTTFPEIYNELLADGSRKQEVSA